MKYLKLYEELNLDKPKIGDYVIVDNNKRYNELNNFVRKHIGIITAELNENNFEVFYKDDYSGILTDNRLRTSIKFIIFWSNFTPENIDFYTNIKNFNL